MTLTVEFEIHPDGHCLDCKARYAGVCRAFGKFAFKRPCAECDTYRERESRKRHCRVCGNQDCNKPFDGADERGPYQFDCAEFTAPPRPEPSGC